MRDIFISISLESFHQQRYPPLDPTDWEPMKSVGEGVREIRLQQEGQYRVIYVASFEEKVYALHAFQEKTKKTSRQDLDAAKRAFREAER